MKTLLSFLVLFLFADVYGHGGDDGPSSLEDEFSKLSHIHLPINYSTQHGLSFSAPMPGHDSHGEEHHEEHDEHEEHHQDEDLEADKTGIDIDIHPVMFGGFDKIKRLVNLDEVEANSYKISAADEDSRFLLIENKKWDLGFGVEGDYHLPIHLLSSGIGISYLKGKTYYSMKVLNHKKEMRAPLELPLDEESIKNWRVGDQLAYATKGSLIFNVFVGIEPFFHVGPEYIHTGTYRVKAFMESENILEVQIITTSSDSFGFEANAIALNAEWMKMKGHLNSVVYEFDLSNPSSFAAIKHLFQGRLDLTNDEMLRSHGDIKMKTSLRNSGRSLSGSFGIPVLYLNGGGSGVYQNEGTLEEAEEDHIHTSQIYSTSLMKESFTRGVLSKHKWMNQSYVSTIYKHDDESIISSAFSWSFSKDLMKSKLLFKKLRKLSMIFNKTKFEEIELPYTDLGYLKADFNVAFSGGDVLFLLNTAQLNTVAKNAIQDLEQDFSTYGHRSFCRIKSEEKCLRGYKQHIMNKKVQLKQLIQALNDDYKQNKLLQVSKKLSLIVKELFASRYLTGAFTKLRPELKMEMRLEGERIKKHSLTF